MNVEFPLYLVRTDSSRQFMSLQEAAAKQSSLWERVTIEGLVLEKNFSVRNITAEERQRITTLADRMDEDK